MSLIIDEYGRPFIVMKDQGRQKRLKGLEALKANINAVRAVADIVKTSFGPYGMDKIIIDADGEVIVTNDGAEILAKMDPSHEMAKLIVQLSQSQDDEIGDGTTGVVILAGALLAEASPLLEMGIHPLTIAKGFDAACETAVAHLAAISTSAIPKDGGEAELRRRLLSTAETTLSSKLVRNEKARLAEMAVDAVLSVADRARRDINFELIRVEGKVGSSLEKSELVKGLVLQKNMAHSQMRKVFEKAKIALLTCAFEPPKPKTKHFIEIESVQHYKQLYEQEQQFFRDMVRMCKDSGADIVFCQWGFDDEATHLLLQNEMPAVRWVGGSEMEALAIATGAKIVGRFEDLTPDKLGTAGLIREVAIGSSSDKMILVEDCPNSKIVTLFLRAGNKMALEEAKRCLHDALCVVRNLVKDDRVVFGGGSCEMSCSLEVDAKAGEISGLLQYGYRAFACALAAIPHALAANSGLDAISAVAELRRAQAGTSPSPHQFDATSAPTLGINGVSSTPSDMREENVFETLIGKRQQLQLATQLAKMVLKTDDIIEADDMDYE